MNFNSVVFYSILCRWRWGCITLCRAGSKCGAAGGKPAVFLLGRYYMAAAGRGHGCHQLCGGASACQPARRGQAKNRADCCHCADGSGAGLLQIHELFAGHAQRYRFHRVCQAEFLDVLPLGISYYTFKLISYTADVYTGKVKAERSPVVFAVYVLMYPQLIVGPIVKYRDMADVLHQTQGRCTLQKAQDGAEMFVFGLAKR